MNPDNASRNTGKKKVSTTKTTEYGYFIRKKTRKGTKRKQKTTYIKKNPEKVTLAKIGELEIYCYPYNYPDRVYIGIFPLSTYIEKGQEGQILGLYNQIRWYFQDFWEGSLKQSKRTKSRRQRIQRAYKSGRLKLKEQ